MIVLAIDPGAAGAGYAVWDSNLQRHTYIGTTCPLTMGFDAIVVESGFIGKMGLKSMWGLGFDAGWRLHDALMRSRSGGRCYTIRPDGVNGWRAALPERPGFAKRFDGLPGDVIVAKLRVRYEFTPEQPTEHEVEACGISEATAAILARPKAKDRKALKAVKR